MGGGEEGIRICHPRDVLYMQTSEVFYWGRGGGGDCRGNRAAGTVIKGSPHQEGIALGFLSFRSDL